MKHGTTIILILIFNVAIGQSSEFDFGKIPAEKLKEDLAILQFNLQTIHAGLYTYTPKLAMDNFFLSMEKEVETSMSNVDFYRRMLSLNELIRNGHTMVIPPEPWSQYVATAAVHIPFDIYTQNDKIFILRNFSDDKNIIEGDEVLSIDGLNAKEILNKLIDSSNKDGYNHTYPLMIINQDFSEYFANVIATKSIYNLKLKQKNGVFEYDVQSKTIEDIRAISKAKYQFNKLPWYAGIANPPLTYEVKNDLAILTLPTFNIHSIEDNGIDYKVFFKETFKDLNQKGIQNLIIDLRGNGGGYADVGTELFSYLHDQPFSLIKDIHTISRKIPNRKYYTGTNFLQRLQLKLALKKENNSKFVPRTWAAKRNNLTLTPKQPSLPTYHGKVYVLIDGWVFSASAMFSALIKNYDRGVFIGEETGGNPNIQIGDFEQMLTLPNSGLRLRIPLFYEEMDVTFDNSGHGIIPNFFKKNSIVEEIAQEDSVLNWVISKIETELEK